MRAVLVLAFLSCAAVTAQLAPPGFHLREARLPAWRPVLAARIDGATASFDRHRLLLSPDGGPNRTLLELTPLVPAWFLDELAPGELVLGAGLDEDVWLVPLAPGTTPRRVGTVPRMRDGAAYDAHRLAVSRDDGNGHVEVVLFDVRDGTTTTVVRMPGRAGPVACSPRGIWVGEVAPQPGLLRFPRDAVRDAEVRGMPLDRSDGRNATPVAGVPKQLAVDSDDDVYVMTAFLGDVWEHDFVAVQGELVALGARRLLGFPVGVSVFGVDLHVVSPPAGSYLDAFQPESDAELLVVEFPNVASGAWRRLTPAEARTVAPGSADPGPFPIDVEGAAPDGLAFVAIGPVPPRGRIEIRVGGFDVPLWWESSLLGSNADLLPVALDGDGRGGVQLVNPGFAAPVDLTAAAVFLDAPGERIAGTAPVVIQLR